MNPIDKIRQVIVTLETLFPPDSEFAQKHNPLSVEVCRRQAEALSQALARIEAERKRTEQLEAIIYDTLWMARRYAHGRSTYAVAEVNDCTALALELGLKIANDKGTVWAKDRDFGWPTELIEKYGRHDVKEDAE